MAAYASIAQLKAHMNKTTAGDDIVLGRLLDASTAWIDRAINQHRPGFEFFDAPASASARLFPGSGLAYQRIDPCISITLVAVKDSVTDSAYTSWAATDWLAYRGSHTFPNFNDLPYTAIMTDVNGEYTTFTSGAYGSKDFYFGRGPSLSQARVGARMTPTVQVTARWGGTESPPSDIVAACIEQAARWYKREQSAMADALASGELGQLIYRLEIDPDIAAKLKGGRHFKPALGIL